MGYLEHDSSEETYLFASTKEKRTTRLVTVEPVLILYTIYFGGSIPLLQQYVYTKTGEQKILDSVITLNSTLECSDLNNLEKNDDAYKAYIIEQDIQRITSLWLVSFSAVLLTPALVSSLMLGSYSDMVGRKIALIASVLGAAVKCAVATIVIWQNLALPFLYIGIFLEGLTGGATTFYTASFAYAADISTREQRAFRIIILEFCLALGILITEIGVGYLIAALGYLWPFLILVGVLVIDLIYILFMLPQSMPSTANLKEAKLFTLSNFKKSFKLYIMDTASKRRWKLCICMVLMFLLGMSELGRNDVSILFVLSNPLCFTSILIGYFAAAAYLLPGIGSVVITKLCQTRLRETGLMMLGCASAALSCILFAFATKAYIVFITCLVGFFGRLPVGMLRSYSSKVVEPDETGALFASLAWLEGLSTLIGKLVFVTIYNATLSWFPGFVFIIIGLLYCASFFITMTLRLREKYLLQEESHKWPAAVSSSCDEKEVSVH